jgi:hypothetical protein
MVAESQTMNRQLAEVPDAKPPKELSHKQHRNQGVYDERGGSSRRGAGIGILSMPAKHTHGDSTVIDVAEAASGSILLIPLAKHGLRGERPDARGVIERE